MDRVLKEKLIRFELKNYQKLSSYACKDTDAIRYKKIVPDMRLQFQRDIDKITYSNSYIRYFGKTQVYTLSSEDHISKRSTHVQYVSRISRALARALGANEDLCEAIALGHDIGHVPFGHFGENVLNDISLKYLGKIFSHNVQSVRNVHFLENNGLGLNLTIQVLDGILCHNGKRVFKEYRPVKKDKNILMQEYEKCYESKEFIKTLVPMTFEGCIVRISDIIAYIGKDIEDAITLGILKREDLPKQITKILGDTNSDIIDHIVHDIIENSFKKGFISMSDDICLALQSMIEFNFENIYDRVYTQAEKDKCKEMFNKLFLVYLDALNNNEIENDIFKVFLSSMNEEYKRSNSNERIAIDFIAGMTDRYMFSQYEKYCNL